MIKNRSIGFKLAFFILTSCVIIFAMIFTYNYIISRRMIEKNIKTCAENLVLVAVNKIESTLRPIEKVPAGLAYFLEASGYDKTALENLLHSVVENNAEIYGSTVAFEPYTFDKESKYFAPYCYKKDGEIKCTHLGDPYRYFGWDWYQIPKELDKPIWSEPYYDEGGGNIIMSTYSVPFYKNIDGKRTFAGVVTADISLSWLKNIVSSIKIEKTGYGFLLSKNGRLVTHPTKSLIMNETIFDLAEEKHAPALRTLGLDMIKGNSGFIVSKSLTGMKCWIVYAPIPSNGWSLGVVFPQDELMADVAMLNATVFFIGFFGFFVLLVVIIAISHSITSPLRALSRTTKDIAAGNLDFKLEPVESKDEVGRLTDSFIYMKNSLKKYIIDLTATTASKERMESELRIAHNIQMGIVPKIFPPFPNRREFEIYAVLKPAKEVGGDFYDFFFIDDSHFCFIIADVTGKGVPSALFMAVTKTLLKTTAKTLVSPDEILAKVNKEIAAENDSGLFTTIFCGVLDTKTGKVQYSNAGHNPPMVMRRGSQPELLIGGRSLPIGIDEEAVFEKGEVSLQPGDTICLYTDGVTEAFNGAREQFSEERLKDGLFRRKDESVERLVKGTLEGVKSFSADVPQSDDITLLALRFMQFMPNM